MAGKAMARFLASGKSKRFFDPRLRKALAHPFREHLFAVFNERIASPTELSREVGMEVPDFYKHITLLEELGFIEEIQIERAIKPHPGKRERFFRARATVELDNRGWLRLPASVRSDWMASHIQLIWDEIVAALRDGVIARGHKPHHLTWLPGIFDRRGWDESLAIMDAAATRLVEVQKLSAERVAVSGEPGIPATIAMLGFETSASKPVL